jgi:hypothetical protein
MAECPAGVEITGDDALILTDLVKHYPYYKTMIEPHGILGFTVKDHPAANGLTVKILVVILASIEPKNRASIHGRLMERDVSIDRCFLNLEGKLDDKWPHERKRVVRQDSLEKAA